ncbi:hypothetical protein CASFOL_012937 [Castilleja foliolosa]|uniref:Glycosyltransferase n=1 Tax=Castilleja foliolosa TaxID=1961234 RepID=A0ABD3DLU0_9LAMI
MATNTTNILAIPFPVQGHINPLAQLCHRLSAKGIRVTFVTTVNVSKTLQTKSNNNFINFETVPDITIDETEGLDFYEIYYRSFRAAITSGIPDIIEKQSNTDSPFKAIVYDSLSPWVLDIASENGLKGAVLFTQSCTVCSVLYHIQKGSLEISHDEGSEVTLPGMPVMGLNDLPSYLLDKGTYPSMFTILVEQFATFGKADWHLFNTFDKLEDEVLNWMRSKYRIQTIGPTIPSMYLDKRLLENYDYGLSLFKHKTESCSEWLDKKDDQSVIYVSFGSLANLSEKQMEEIAWGLIATTCNFLWVVRDSEQNKLPKDFISSLEVSDQKGIIVNWCSQLEVLSHQAVGCFVTHGGWNSTLEGLSLGVPMVVVPQWTDQPTNAMFVGEVWRTGVRCKKDGNGIVGREEVKACVDSVMKGDDVRKNAEKWKGLAVEAVSEGGSSELSLDEFAMELLSI